MYPLNYLNPLNVRIRSTDPRPHPFSYQDYDHQFFKSENIRTLVSYAQQVADDQNLESFTATSNDVLPHMNEAFVLVSARHVPAQTKIYDANTRGNLPLWTARSGATRPGLNTEVFNTKAKELIRIKLLQAALEQRRSDRLLTKRVGGGGRSSFLGVGGIRPPRAIPHAANEYEPIIFKPREVFGSSAKES